MQGTYIFKDKDDMKPTKEYLTLYKGLFDKKFKKVYSRQELFGLKEQIGKQGME